MYKLNGKVRYSETDAGGKLSYTALLNYFQDSSTFHSESLEAGVKSLAERKMAWVLSFWQICIEDMPGLSEDIVVSTWPYKTQGLFGQRNFCMERTDGERLVYANSIWVLIDTETGRPMRIPQDVSDTYPSEPMLDMNYSERKIAVPAEYIQMEPIPVHRYLIDTNRHVNNANYVMLAEGFLPENFKAHEIRVEYKKAAVLNDILYPRVTIGTHDVTVVLGDEKGSPYATVLFIGRN